eukprot:1023610-Rhodomonas_salina.3
MEYYEELADSDVDMLEPNPSNSNEALRNACLCPFWIDFERKEMEGIWRWGVWGSQFHYNIKLDGATVQITNCKVRLMVMGNQMREGEDYEDSFAPLPRIWSCTPATQCTGLEGFIQADTLNEGVNGWFFIRLPQGTVEDADTVFEVCQPLYGIPSSARALHLTLSHWFKEEGFTTAGFEDSVWVREDQGK